MIQDETKKEMLIRSSLILRKKSAKLSNREQRGREKEVLPEKGKWN